VLILCTFMTSVLIARHFQGNVFANVHFLLIVHNCYKHYQISSYTWMSRIMRCSVDFTACKLFVVIVFYLRILCDHSPIALKKVIACNIDITSTNYMYLNR
jgi:hypothetical protein